MTTIDRRADYYRRAADHIAADPLDFYTRAERGRRFQARFVVVAEGKPVANVVTLRRRGKR